MSTTVANDKFQSRDELVSFIEQQTQSAVEKAARVERRVPWAASGPVCQIRGVGAVDSCHSDRPRAE